MHYCYIPKYCDISFLHQSTVYYYNASSRKMREVRNKFNWLRIGRTWKGTHRFHKNREFLDQLLYFEQTPANKKQRCLPLSFKWIQQQIWHVCICHNYSNTLTKLRTDNMNFVWCELLKRTHFPGLHEVHAWLVGIW